MTKLTPAPPAYDHTAIPIYQLYGYGNVWNTPDPLYCETIAAQEKLHNWHVTAHKHINLFQLLYMQSGAVSVFLDSEPHTINAQSILLIPPGVVHEFIFEPGAKGYILTMTSSLMLKLCKELKISLLAKKQAQIILLTNNNYDSYIGLSISQLNHEYRAALSPQRGPLLEALLINILVWLERKIQPLTTISQESTKGNRHLIRYLQLIESNFNRHHAVSWYANQIGLSPAHLNTTILSLSGKTALELIHDRILLEARRELIYTNRPILIIAEKLGFNDPSYFTRFFKRSAGISPTQFRNQTTGS